MPLIKIRAYCYHPNLVWEGGSSVPGVQPFLTCGLQMWACRCHAIGGADHSELEGLGWLAGGFALPRAVGGVWGEKASERQGALAHPHPTAGL